ncbi:MAG: hypothetical protein R2809_03685 [Flavobacteriales bacterium]
MKKIILSLGVVLAFISASAQLSDRTNYDQHIRLGARPVAGDAALQFVIPIVSATDAQGSFAGNLLSTGDLLTFKYYKTDVNVIRAGIRLSTNNWANSGTVADSTALTPPPADDLAEFVSRSVDRQFNLSIGMEKHFTPKNIFDVYAGGDVLIGLGKMKTREFMSYDNNDEIETITSTNTQNLGFALVTGFNVFIAELPVSLGLEYGLNGMWTFGGRTKVNQTSKIGSTSNDGEWFEQDFDLSGAPDDHQYSKLKRREFNMNTNQMVRLNLHIYFGTGNNASAPMN